MAALLAAVAFAWPRLSEVWEDEPADPFAQAEEAENRCPLAADAFVYHTPEGYFVWSPGPTNGSLEDTWYRVADGCEEEARQIVEVVRLPKRAFVDRGG